MLVWKSASPCWEQISLLCPHPAFPCEDSPALHSSTNQDTHLFQSHAPYYRLHVPPFESTFQFLKPTCHALPAAWGLISRTVSRRGRGLPEKRRDFAWGKEPGVRGTRCSPHRGKGCVDRRRSRRSPPPKSQAQPEAPGCSPSAFYLPAQQAGN